MRPLFHPSIDDVTVESILHALSDPVRVAIFAEIATSECSQTCSDFLSVSEKNIPKSTLSQHFKALRDAGLIRGERRGVEMFNTSRCKEIEGRFPGLLAAIVSAYSIQSGNCNKGAKYVAVLRKNAEVAPVKAKVRPAAKVKAKTTKKK